MTENFTKICMKPAGVKCNYAKNLARGIMYCDTAESECVHAGALLTESEKKLLKEVIGIA